MQIPKNFKQVQKRVFQDKIFYHMKAEVATGGLGSVTMKPDHKSRKAYTGNVQFVSDKMIAEEYGLRIGVDINITSSDPLNMEKSDYIEYESELYKLTETPKYDSYCAYYAVRE